MNTFERFCVCHRLPATILSCGWIIYLTYYNSRNIGLILTLIINRLYKDGYIHIGEFFFNSLFLSLSPLNN